MPVADEMQRANPVEVDRIGSRASPDGSVQAFPSLPVDRPARAEPAVEVSEASDSARDRVQLSSMVCSPRSRSPVCSRAAMTSSKTSRSDSWPERAAASAPAVTTSVGAACGRSRSPRRPAGSRCRRSWAQVGVVDDQGRLAADNGTATRRSADQPTRKMAKEDAKAPRVSSASPRPRARAHRPQSGGPALGWRGRQRCGQHGVIATQ